MEVRKEFLQTVWYESKRAGLDVDLVLGLIQVESGFRKFAVSSAGARGYMQVVPFWTKVLGDGDAGKLFHMQTNLRFGCVILRHYIDRERGDLYMALGRYNGSRGQPQYPNALLATTSKIKPNQNRTRGPNQRAASTVSTGPAGIRSWLRSQAARPANQALTPAATHHQTEKPSKKKLASASQAPTRPPRF